MFSTTFMKVCYNYSTYGIDGLQALINRISLLSEVVALWQ